MNSSKVEASGLRLREMMPEIFFGLIFISSSIIGLLKQVYWMVPIHALTGLGLLMLVFYGARPLKN